MRALAVAGLATLLFFALAAGFLLLIGQPPLAIMLDLVGYAFGDPYSLSESLVKATPILFCALAVIVPARLGLISVGGDGQLYCGALVGTGIVLAMPDAPLPLLMPAMLAGGALGGAAMALVAGGLRARFHVNETITTLLLNYVGVLLVNFVVYGPWKDPGNLGWPATITFPPAATVPGLFGTRAHAGLVIAVALAVLFHLVFGRGRLGLQLRILRDNERVGRMAGLSFAHMVVLTMAVGGATAGLAGIIETSAIQGRLQPGISLGYGLTGFLVAWLAGHNFLTAIPLAVLIGGLMAAGDTLQLFAKVPASSVTILSRDCSSWRCWRPPALPRTTGGGLMGAWDIAGTWVAATLRATTPLLFALLGETLVQRTAIINLGVEGQMLVGAFAGFAAGSTFGDPWIALLVGGLAGLLLSGVHAGLCLGAGANQIGSGIAVWLLGLGISSFYGRPFVGAEIVGFGPLVAHPATGLPFVDQILSQLTLTTLVALALVPLIGVWLFRSRTGLNWRAVGESFATARALGLRPWLIQLQAILFGGFLAGIGGAVLSVDYTETWAQDITKGRGLVAVALVIAARWNPLLALPVALLFGGSEAAVLRLQAQGIETSSYLLAATPYVICIVIMWIGYLRIRGNGYMPAELGRIFD